MNEPKILSGSFFYNFLSYPPLSFFEPIVEKILKITWVNQCYTLLRKDAGEDLGKLIINWLNKLEITMKTHFLPNAHIPKTGGCIIVANHEGALLDAMVLIQELSKHRKDIKFISSKNNESIEQFKPWCLYVDLNRKAKKTSNAIMLTQAVKWLRAGNALVVFPDIFQKEKAPFYQWDSHLSWSHLPTQFSALAKAPIIPIKIKLPLPFIFRLSRKFAILFYNLKLPSFTQPFIFFVFLINFHLIHYARGRQIVMTIGEKIDYKESKANGNGNELRDYVYNLTHK